MQSTPVRGGLGAEMERESNEAALLAEVAALKSENVKFEGECYRLQQLLDEKKKHCDVLLDQDKQSQEHILEWQEHCLSSEKLISMLKERLEAIRKELREQDVLKEDLHADLQVVQEDLKTFKIESKQDQCKISELLQNLEDVQLQNMKLRKVCASQEMDLGSSRAELASLRASVSNYRVQETQHKSAIRSLEDEVRHLQHVKNRLFNMGTHYAPGYESPPENRSTYSKTSPIRSKLSPPPSLSGHAHSPSHTHSSPVALTQHAEDPSVLVTPDDRPLTRRKWLESSDPGLFGVTPTNYDLDEAKKLSKVLQFSPSTRGSGSVTPVTGRAKGLTFDIHLDPLASSVLKAIKDGKISTDNSFHRKHVARSEMGEAERIKKHAEVVIDAERRLDRLLAEKESLESALRRAPRIGLRTGREARQIQIDREERLEDVVQELGSVRMILRQHHVLGNKK